MNLEVYQDIFTFLDSIIDIFLIGILDKPINYNISISKAIITIYLYYSK